jgi:hypothetical protein
VRQTNSAATSVDGVGGDNGLLPTTFCQPLPLFCFQHFFQRHCYRQKPLPPPTMPAAAADFCLLALVHNLWNWETFLEAASKNDVDRHQRGKRRKQKHRERENPQGDDEGRVLPDFMGFIRRRKRKMMIVKGWHKMG